MNKDHVFFILGSARSGTTLLRNILRSHPNLTCPEETHVFRWGEPFGSSDYEKVYKVAETLKYHRELDGISEEKFLSILNGSKDRGEFLTNYLEAFCEITNDTHLRCFDKTPQNVYGIPLIKAYFPNAKFIHIVRNPLNVITSLKLGHSFSPQTIRGALNFWKEAVLILNTLKPLWGNDIYEFRYEDLTENPEIEISKVLDFLGENIADMPSIPEGVHPALNAYLDVLTTSEIAEIRQELHELMDIYSY